MVKNEKGWDKMRSIWHEIKKDENITALIETFGFEECCVKEMHYDSGAYVDRRRKMQAANKKRKLSMLLQSKEKDCKAIEMVFEGIECMKLQPANLDYTAEIHGVHMCFEENMFVWIDSDDYSESYTELYDFMDVTWIKAQKVKWREVKIRNGKKSWYVKHEQDKKYYNWGVFNLLSLIPSYVLCVFLLSLLFPQQLIVISIAEELKYIIVILALLFSPISCIAGIVKGIRNRQKERFGIKCAVLSTIGLILFFGILAWIITFSAVI